MSDSQEAWNRPDLDPFKPDDEDLAFAICHGASPALQPGSLATPTAPGLGSPICDTAERIHSTFAAGVSPLMPVPEPEVVYSPMGKAAAPEVYKATAPASALIPICGVCRMKAFRPTLTKCGHLYCSPCWKCRRDVKRCSLCFDKVLAKQSFRLHISEMVCAACLSSFQAPVALKCGHVFCKGCLRESCQICGATVNKFQKVHLDFQTFGTEGQNLILDRTMKTARLTCRGTPEDMK